MSHLPAHSHLVQDLASQAAARVPPPAASPTASSTTTARRSLIPPTSLSRLPPDSSASRSVGRLRSVTETSLHTLHHQMAQPCSVYLLGDRLPPRAITLP